MKKNFLFFYLITFVLSSCSPIAPQPEQAGIETIVAGTLQALTAIPAVPTTEIVPVSTAEVAPIESTATNGKQINFGKISFVIPIGLATGASEIKKEAIPPSEGMPFWEIRPASVEYEIIDYVISDAFHDAKIYVYPIAEFIAINDSVTDRVAVLKSLTTNPNQPLPQNLPFLPTFNAGQMFHSNFSTVNFQNGSGIRYLTEFSQFPHPIYNEELTYTFQGITADGLYYVSAILPVNANLLVGYPTPTDQGDFTYIQSEVERVTQQLNSSPPESFTPSLLTLDALIQSMLVTGIP